MPAVSKCRSRKAKAPDDAKRAPGSQIRPGRVGGPVEGGDEPWGVRSAEAGVWSSTMNENVDSGAMAALVAAVARELRATTPTPKGAPFFGIDMGLGFDPAVLTALSDPGIFRKYELVLLFDAGLGGTARWLASQLGCRVVAIEADEPTAAAAQCLNERAHMQDAVRFIVARDDSLPVGDRSFTHAWFVGDLRRATPARIDAAYHALRPGGQLAFQSSIATDGEDTRRLVGHCVQAGFTAVEVRSIAAGESPPAFRTAWQKMAGMARDKGLGRAGAAWQQSLQEARQLVQVHAHRPS